MISWSDCIILFVPSFQLIYLIECLRNSITEPNCRVANVVALFIGQMATVMMSPAQHIYPVLVQFLTIKPQIQMTAVPLFHRLFYSTNLKVSEAAGLTVYGDSKTRCNPYQTTQIKSPNDEFIIPKEKQRVDKNCIKINVFKQLNIPYNWNAHRPNTCNACKVAEFVVTNENGAQKQLFRRRNFNYWFIPHTFVV